MSHHRGSHSQDPKDPLKILSPAERKRLLKDAKYTATWVPDVVRRIGGGANRWIRLRDLSRIHRDGLRRYLTGSNRRRAPGYGFWQIVNDPDGRDVVNFVYPTTTDKVEYVQPAVRLELGTHAEPFVPALREGEKTSAHGEDWGEKDRRRPCRTLAHLALPGCFCPEGQSAHRYIRS